MSRNIVASDGGSIWIRGDEHGVRILVFGRDNVAHDMIELTPAEAGKVRKAIDKAIDRAVAGIEGFACKGLADLNEVVEE